jgi:C1A family cysteine protease
MMTALSKTVVSIGIQADQNSFQLYKSGVFTGACGSSLDHAVALTGYGSQNGLDYYILRNSWGQSWGQSGYMLIGKGNDPATGKPYNNGAGQCGLLMEGSYPVM